MKPIGLRRIVQGRASALLFLLVLVFLMGGCAMVSRGRMGSISTSQVDTLQIGVSKKEDVVALLGKPQQVVRKPNGMEVYVYSHGWDRSIGVPFLISIGRAAASGQTLNVIFKDSVVVDYEYIVDDRSITK